MQNNSAASTILAAAPEGRYARGMNMRNTGDTSVATYDRRTIVLHWLTAALVLALWVAGQTIDFFPKGTPRVTARSLHITAGVLLALVVLWRITWRLRGGVHLPPSDPGVAGAAAVVVHRVLYGLVVAVVVLGFTSVWIRGDTLFNWFTVPAFTTDNRELREQVVDLHGLGANILLAIAALHGAAAIWHHVARRDGVLRRMWP
ncbi:MAG: cytochrome b/b6 domain-containing protein [Burkholderiales bacterium]